MYSQVELCDIFFITLEAEQITSKNHSTLS